jgi:hypothetical protein
LLDSLLQEGKMVAVMGREFKLEAFKEPRGFIRFLELVFTMLAFSFCAGFSSHLEFVAECKSDVNVTSNQTFSLQYSYPFSLDHANNLTVDLQKCPVTEDATFVNFPGDFSSDAKFYVFIGVVSWLFCILTVLMYGFNNEGYLDNKNYPMYDMIAAALICFFFLAGSSAWAHGLSGLKYSSDPSTWIFQSNDALICKKTEANSYVQTAVKRCIPTSVGTFAGANVSVLLGFLNCFLFGANVYYLFKETRFYNANQGNLENSPSGLSGGSGGSN